MYYPTAAFRRILVALGILDSVATTKIAGGSQLFSSVAGVPGATFVTAIRLDTTNKLCYVWDGSQYVKIADYA
jgi:hypothetical protein